jgi:Zn-dependent protease
MALFDAQWLFRTAMIAPPLLLSLTLHEYAHARAALAFGDTTARDQGRLSLNPLAHLDPIGTLVLLVTQMFGWARPVPVNPGNLHPRRLGDIAVSLAGPMTNLGLAFAAGLTIRLAGPRLLELGESGMLAFTVLYMTMLVNVGLCAFNLLPLFPLDGHHIARELLPRERQFGFMRWQIQYGRFLLMGLILGPMLLGSITGRNVPDPLGWFFQGVISAAEALLGLSGP